MSDLVKVRRALLSVSDKTDLIPFARSLASFGVTLISTGGTARALAEAGLDVVPVESVTGFPEGLGGRVKTLHPAIHGALLAVRDDPAHQKFLAEHTIEPIDLVCINLYPFEKAVADPGCDYAEAIENIDVGGPAMIRAAAKNHRSVAVVTSPTRYDHVIAELARTGGQTTRSLRADLAAAAFARTAEYDAAIAAYLGRRAPAAFPHVLRLGYVLASELRYGENPHQQAGLYRDPASTGPTVVNAAQHHGKELSYNNINDSASALEVVKALARLAPGRHAACVVKHNTPCGVAVADSLETAVDRAIAGDPLAAYGGIIAVMSELDAPAARRIAAKDSFFEVVLAPSYEAAALDILRDRWQAVRVLEVGSRAGSPARKLEYRSVPGGMLVQDRDVRPALPDQWRHAAGPAPARETLAAAAVLETAVRFAISNAVAIGGADGGAVRLFGVGSGQVDRVSACRLAVEKAKTSAAAALSGGGAGSAAGVIAVSDAFFPFDDGPRVLIDAGVTAIVHPGGSKRDEDTFNLCNERGVTCLVTGTRRFRH